MVRSHELDTHSTFAYEEDGARMLNSASWGPLHEVRLEDGETAETRQHAKVVPDRHSVLPAVCRLRYWPKTRAYVQRRTTEGKTKREIMRCLKRYIAREVHASLRRDLGSLSLTP